MTRPKVPLDGVCPICSKRVAEVAWHLGRMHGGTGGKGRSELRILAAVAYCDPVAVDIAVDFVSAGDRPPEWLHPDDRLAAGVKIVRAGGSWNWLHGLGLNGQTITHLQNMHKAGALPAPGTPLRLPAAAA